MATLTCKFCSKVCKNQNSLRNHERLCPENPDRKYISHSIGRTPWNKGKKKDQDPRIAAQAAHLKARFDSGDLNLIGRANTY